MTQLIGTSGADTLNGGDGADYIEGLGGADRLAAGGGDDLVVGGFGDTLLDGGAGTDLGRFDFAGATGSLNFTVGVTSTVAGAQISGFEQVEFKGGSAGDRLTGGGLADLLDGGGGNDWLKGGGGDDTLTGGGGNDSLAGGDGIDFARFSGSRADYDVLLNGDGSISIFDMRNGGDGLDQISGVERFTFVDGALSLLELINGAANHAPVAQADTATTDENSTVVIDVRANDTDVDPGDYLTVTAVDNAGSLGTAQLSNGVVTYFNGGAANALAAGETMTDSFGYTVTDLSGATSTARVTVTVTGVNDAPEAFADQKLVGEDGGTTIQVLANDTDIDHGDQVSLVSASHGIHGRTAVVDGAVTYTPGAHGQSLNAGQTLTDSFTYTVRDLAGETSTTTVNVTIQGANDAPEAADDTVTVGKLGVSNLGGLLNNDGDADNGDGFSITAVDAISTSGASVSIGADGKLAYDPGQIFADLPAGQTAIDSFTYTITDSHGATSTATVNLTVSSGAVAEPELILNAYVREDETTEDLTQLVLDQAGYLFGEGVTLVGVDTTGTLGSVNFGSGVLTYTADDPEQDLYWGDATDEAVFLYTVRTASGELHTGAIEVDVEGMNDAPIAGADTVAVGEGASTQLWTTLMANDVELDTYQEATITGVDTTGTVGRVSFDAGAHSLVYHADTAALQALGEGEVLVDHFTYTLSDDYDATTTGVVTVTVTGDGEMGWALA